MKKLVLLFVSAFLLFGDSAAYTANNTVVQQHTVITGTLLGHDGKPMSKAHVHLNRINETKPLVSVEVSLTGSFQFATSETGLLRLQFTGANHMMREVPLLAEKPLQLKIHVQLEAYEYANNFENVKIAGDFNEFSAQTAQAMKRHPNGTYVAVLKASGVKFAYQLLNIEKHGRSINGTQSEDYVYDGGGDYRSVVTPKKGRVKIVFDPKLLARSNATAQLTFEKANYVEARFASIYDGIKQRRNNLSNAVAAYKKTGSPLHRFRFDRSSDLANLSKQIAEERNQTLRQALLLAYLDLGYGSYGAQLDPAVVQMTLAEIAPNSPLWSFEPYLVEVAVRNSKREAQYAKYILEIINNHPDPEVKRIIRAVLSPDRKIKEGKKVPPFSLPSLDDPKQTFTPESLKGKVYLIDFWAVWCQPCVAEMENLHEVYGKFKPQGLEILSLSLDAKPEDVNEFRRDKWKMPWLHSFVGLKGGALKQFEVVGIPKTILVNRNGEIVATGVDLRGSRLSETLEQVFQSK